MAIGKKTKPNGAFEVGDLISSKVSGGKYYVSNNLKSETEEIDTSETTFGQITELGVPSSGMEIGIWIAVRLSYSPKVVYVPQDSTLYKSVVNPEYNYGPVGETKKSNFSWEGLFGTISGIATAALGIFSNAKKTATPIGEQQAKDEQEEEDKPGAWDWIKANILWIVIMPTFLVLIILVIRIFTKPKPTVQPPVSTPPKLFK